MNRRLLISACALLFAACAWTTPARADTVPWSYNWTPGSLTVPATAGSGFLTLTNEPPSSVYGDTDVVATNVRTVSSAGPDAPDVFTNAAYSLTMQLTDDQSGLSGNLTFTGLFNGQMTSGSAKITNAFTGLQTQSVTLGLHEYTVTVGPYLPPGPPNASNAGGIGASVTVLTLEDSTGNPDGGPVTHPTPEPSSMVLAGLGCSALLLLRFRRKRTNPIPA